jgi:hypothetical protein
VALADQFIEPKRNIAMETQEMFTYYQMRRSRHLI